MAANLLSDLDDFYNPINSRNVTQPSQNNITQSASTKASFDPNYDLLGDTFGSTKDSGGASAEQTDLDDDFGDFETAEPSNVITRKDDNSEGVRDATRFQTKPATNQVPKKLRDENVLFDAEDEPSSGEDEFGDFEEGTIAHRVILPSVESVTQQHKESVQAASLIDLEEAPQTHPPQPKANAQTHEAFRSSAVRQGDSSLSFGKKQNLKSASAPIQPAKVSAASVTPEVLDNDAAEWQDFETIAQPNDAEGNSNTGKGNVTEKSRLSDPGPSSADAQLPFRLDPLLDKSVPSSPQTNIPPPTILLSIFPSIAEKASSQFFKPLSQYATDLDTQQAVYGNSQVRAYIESLLAVTLVLARIVAGRKNRWKRDTILAQSMRISQASAGGRSGGMKLAGLDKAGNAREERDVADAVRGWQGILGRLRSAVNAAKLGTVPPVSEEYLVRTATEKEGAIAAAKQCILCGLKRNERVAKVDAGVQDSFGEWWVEHWGHRDCALFWNTYEKSLQGR